MSQSPVKQISELEAAVARLNDLLHDRDASFYMRRDISLVLDALATAQDRLEASFEDVASLEALNAQHYTLWKNATARASRYEAALRRIADSEANHRWLARATLAAEHDTKEDGDGE